jgi:integrase/recombinase XerD
MMARRARKAVPLLPIGPAHDPQSLYAQMLAFLAYIEERNYSPDTCTTWLKYLHGFIAWCDERGLTKPTEITRPVIERYQRHLFLYRKANGLPLSIGSQHGRITPIRAWFRWLTRTNRLLYNPAADLDLPKLEQRLPRNIPGEEEMERLLNVPDVTGLPGVRDRAILETLYSTGMRRMELVNLHVRDVDWERGTVMIRQGKGGKDRMVPIGERALAWVARYCDTVRPEFAVAGDVGVLFLAHEGDGFTRNGLSNVVSRYVKRSGIGKAGGCHLFRHAMATQMLENGADIRFIQAMLGHSDLNTTRVYTQVSIRALKDIHTATHPARLGRTVQNRSDPGDGPPATAAELLAALDDETAEENGG